MSPQAAVRAIDLRVENRKTRFGIQIRDPHNGSTQIIEDLTVSIPGEHNVQNATGAIAIAHQLGIGEDAIRKGLAAFSGVKRRFTHTGTWDGVDVFDDYGHHPVEIAAVLKAARSVAPGHVIAIVQPHRFTRLRDLFDGFCSCFNDADTVIVAPVYPAGEQPIPGIDREALVEGLRTRGHRDARALSGPDALAETVAGVAKPGDYVVCLGAGSISQWAYALPGQLAKLGGK
jgi:UDP-N-acetylmuramate--alanine ligase